MLRSTNAALIALLLAGCETTNSDNWTGGATTPFNQAERSCLSLAQDVAEEADRREMFVGCMAALGWSPRPGASIDI
ncbi:MAG: hypothetical protein ACEQR8_00655 [Cypionkella sp.]